MAGGEFASEGYIRGGPHHGSSDMPEQLYGDSEHISAVPSSSGAVSIIEELWEVLQACGSPPIRTKRLHLLTTGLLKLQLPSRALAVHSSEHWEN